MIPRNAHATLLRLSNGFPVVALTGPRQSGKTTLAKAAFPGKPYVSLENPIRDARSIEPKKSSRMDFPGREAKFDVGLPSPLSRRERGFTPFSPREKGRG